MLNFAKSVTIFFSFLFLLELLGPLWIDISPCCQFVYLSITTVVFALITIFVPIIVRKRIKRFYCFLYLDSYYSKKFTNEQYIKSIELINYIYDDKSNFIREENRNDLLKRKKSLKISLECEKISFENLLPIIVSAVLGCLLPLFQPEKETITLTSLSPSSIVQVNWASTVFVLTVFLMFSIELIKIKAPNLRSECMEYEIEKIDAFLHKCEKNSIDIRIKAAFMCLDEVSGKTKERVETNMTISGFLSEYNALDDSKKKKLTEIMNNRNLYEIVFKKGNEKTSTQ